MLFAFIRVRYSRRYESHASFDFIRVGYSGRYESHVSFNFIRVRYSRCYESHVGLYESRDGLSFKGQVDYPLAS